MSTMKCGPDKCPITTFSDLTPAEQREQRARKAKEMANRGFTEQQIAKQLGVSQATIAGDLKNFNLSVSDKLKPAKTAANPRGAGRPKGTRKRSERLPKAVEREGKVEVLRDAGLSVAEISAEIGLCERSVSAALEHVDIRREAEPLVDASELSLTQQQKNEIWRRQEMKRLGADFEAIVQARVSERVKTQMDYILSDQLRKQIDEAKDLYNRRHHLMTRATFNTIRRALHPDSRKSISDEMLAKAFDLFMALEKKFLDEKDSPTHWGPPLPSSWAEWEKMKVKRTRKHGNGTVART